MKKASELRAALFARSVVKPPSAALSLRRLRQLSSARTKISRARSAEPFFISLLGVTFVALAATGLCQAQEPAQATSPESKASGEIKQDVISDVNRDWTYLIQGGLDDGQGYYVLGERTRIAFRAADDWRVGVGYFWDYYIHRGQTRNDIIPTVDTYYIPNEDESYFAELDCHLASNTSQAFTGAISADLQLADTTAVRFSLTREIVQDSFLSAMGENTPSGKGGQVRSDLVNGQYLYMPSREWEFMVSASTGIFEGLETPNNFTWAATAGGGYTVHEKSVKIRIGVDITANSFDKDASGFFGQPNAPGVIPGGYFSPQFYLLEQARLDMDWQLGEPTKLHVGGGFGPQNYRSETRNFSETDFGLDIETRFDLRFAEGITGFVFYEYHNVGASIEQSRFGFGARVVF